MLKKNILVADDSASMRSLIAITLKGAGYSVTEAADGKEAASMARQWKFSLVLTDKNMPRMNGIELLKDLRSLPAYRSVPILLLTTDGSQESKMEGKALGATGWLIKPFSPSVLREVVEKLV